MARQKATTTETAAAPVYPKLSVIEKRIKAGGKLQPMNVAEVPLTNQPEPMATRWINTEITGRFWQVTESEGGGWTPVRPDEVLGGVGGDLRAHDGQVVRGEKGKEVLVKMPKRLYELIQREKAQTLERQMRSEKGLRNRINAQMEREAKVGDRGAALDLERQSETLGGLHVDALRVSKDMVTLEN